MKKPKIEQSRWMNRIRLAVFVLVLAAILYFLLSDFAPNRSAVENLLQEVQARSLGLPTMVLIFVVLGLVGTPQFLLIAASIFVFGPIVGSAYSWIGTMVSASLHFWLGRWIGADFLRRFAGAQVAKIIRFVNKNGFWSSLLVRVVPSGPFIVVNLALGVSRARFEKFMIGTGIGILPKILVLAFVGQGLSSFFGHQNISLVVFFFGVALAIFLLIWFLHRAWKANRNQLG